MKTLAWAIVVAGLLAYDVASARIYRTPDYEGDNVVEVLIAGSLLALLYCTVWT
jgi:hypothetical protein